jgi:hypothetical protein
MDSKRLIIGTVVGGITLHVLGYVIWVMALADFFAANTGSATGVSRDAPLMWAIALGNLSLGALLTLAIGSRPKFPSIGEGFKIGAIVGFLIWLGVDFILYGLNNVSNLTATIADPLLEIVHNGVAGTVIVAVIGRIRQSGATGV